MPPRHVICESHTLQVRVSLSWGSSSTSILGQWGPVGADLWLGPCHPVSP